MQTTISQPGRAATAENPVVESLVERILELESNESNSNSNRRGGGLCDYRLPLGAALLR
jgi:hypothetical protein